MYTLYGKKKIDLRELSPIYRDIETILSIGQNCIKLQTDKEINMLELNIKTFNQYSKCKITESLL